MSTKIYNNDDMFMISNPKWIESHIFNYNNYEEIPKSVFSQINARLSKLQGAEPLVSIVISAWNEERNLLNCISSLSLASTTIPFEIIVVNNNSSDRTQDVIDELNVKGVVQEIQGCGPARQLGQEHASSEYILLADADCIYPPRWIDTMLCELKKEGVVCVYGSYSFIGNIRYQRWKLFVLEMLKSVIAEIKHLKRPYLNAYGLNMGYVTELGLKVGYSSRNVRGTDGRLCFDLMQYGKISHVRSSKARIWTCTRALERDGGYRRALLIRLKKEARSFVSLFSSHPQHNTKET